MINKIKFYLYELTFKYPIWWVAGLNSALTPAVGEDCSEPWSVVVYNVSNIVILA